MARGGTDGVLGRLVLRLTGAFLLGAAVVALVAPLPVNTPYRWVVVVPTTLVLVVLVLVVRLPVWLENRTVAGVSAVVGGVIAAGLGLATRYDYGWDARVALDVARAVEAGRPLTAAQRDYLSLFPNNLPLVAVDRAGIRVGEWLGVDADVVLVTFAGVCVAITLYAAHHLVRNAASARAASARAASVTQLVVLLLVATSPWLAVPYTDVYAMPFVVGGVALGCAALRSRDTGTLSRVGLWLLAIGVISVAFVVKTTPVVVVVAMVLVGLIAATRAGLPARRRAAILGWAAAGVAGFVLVAAGVSGSFTAAAGVGSQVRAEAAPPVLWWIALGADEQTSAAGAVTYGSYSRVLVDAVEGRSREDASRFARDLLADRWSERGPAGTARFYADKAAWNWGDGMFWAWGEGTDADRVRLERDSGATEFVQEVNAPGGAWYSWRTDLTQGLWLAVLVVAGLGLLRARPRPELLFVALSVLGIAAFTLLFQGRSRYLFTFIPIVVALAGMVHSETRPGLSRWSR